jgi:ubiquinol-cytochrome c reductase cytochrome c subunit
VVLRMFYRVLLFTAIFTIFASSLGISQAPESSLTGDAEKGKKLYVTYFCWSCHGSNGRAGGAAPAITPSTRSAEDLIKYVRKPRGAMPPYTSKSISDKDLADIAAFLRTVPKDPDPKTIPLLNEQ